MRARFPAFLTVAAVSGALQFAGSSAFAEDAKVFVPESVMQTVSAAQDVNAKLPDGSTALQWAVYERNVAEVERLLRAGADVSAVSNYGATAMSLAATTGDAAIIRLLLKAGADPESANAEGQTALMSVARTGNVEAAKLLIKAGAKVNATEQWGGQTALMWAAAKHQPEMISLLIRHGADVNARSVVRDWGRKVTSEPREKKMDRGGLAALHFAAREGCVPCIGALVKGGADIDLQDGLGTTPLVLAIMNLRFDTAKALIEQGAHVEIWDQYGVTPLYAAVDMNVTPLTSQVELPPMDRTTGLDLMRMLIERGANVNARIKLPLPSRINMAGGRADKRVHNIGATPLLRAAVGADLEAMQLLIDHGAIVDLPMADGTTPMLAALMPSPNRVPGKTEQHALEAIRLLKAAGADPNDAVTKSGTALHMIHTHGQNEARVRGSTALMMATVQGWKDVMKQLVDWGVNVDAQDADGLTALDYAMGRARLGFLQQRPEPRTDVADYLKTLGARLEHPDLPPWKPLNVPKITAVVPEPYF